MKLTMRLLVLFFGVLLLANVAYAETPREQLKQMVEQLQKNPADSALREKIISLARTLKPAPSIPDEAIRYEGRAQYRFGHATNELDYHDAAKEYERAVAAAPWVVGYYADLCTIYEKAGKLADAKRNCQFTLAGTSDPAQAADMKRRIGGLEIGIEQSSREDESARQAALQQEKDSAFLNSLNGGVWLCDEDNFGRYVIEIVNRQATYVHYARSGNVYRHAAWTVTGRTSVVPQANSCLPGSAAQGCPGESTISADGNVIVRPLVKDGGNGRS